MKHLFILSPIIWLLRCKHPYTVHDSSQEKPAAESLDLLLIYWLNYQWQMCHSRGPEQNSENIEPVMLLDIHMCTQQVTCTGNTGNLLGYRTRTVCLHQSDHKYKDYGLLPTHRPGTHGHYKDGCHAMRLLLQDRRCTKAKPQPTSAKLIPENLQPNLTDLSCD